MLIAIASIIGALLIGTISPGPSFVMVARTALARSRRDGLAAALGMGLGGVIFGGLALLGLRGLIAQANWLFVALKLLGGLYLLYLAWRLWRGAPAPLVILDQPIAAAGGWWKSCALGLATQLSNPKTAIVYASVFAALLPTTPPSWIGAVLLPLIFANEAGWYGLVALGFSAVRPRAAYLRTKTLIDRLAGAVMGLLGLRLILETSRAG